MTRTCLLAIAFSYVLVACSSEPEFTVPPNDFVFQIECEAQATGLPEQLLFDREFSALQAALVNGDASLSDSHQALFAAATSNSLSRTPDGLDYVPQRIPDLFEPGVTTSGELRQKAGVAEVGRLANYLASFYDFEDLSPDIERYTDSLLGHCDAFFEEDIRALCDAGDPDSCVRRNRIDRRDLAIVAEACELAPYMLLCEPEDPPPYDLPRINEG